MQNKNKTKNALLSYFLANHYFIYPETTTFHKNRTLFPSVASLKLCEETGKCMKSRLPGMGDILKRDFSL